MNNELFTAPVVAVPIRVLPFVRQPNHISTNRSTGTLSATRPADVELVRVRHETLDHAVGPSFQNLMIVFESVDLWIQQRPARRAVGQLDERSGCQVLNDHIRIIFGLSFAPWYVHARRIHYCIIRERFPLRHRVYV